MKQNIALLLFFISLLSTQKLEAASIKARPFELKFFLEQDHINVNAQLNLTCRHERWVIGDSAVWEMFHLKAPLQVTQSKSGDLRLMKIALLDEKFLEVKGVFKPSKECKAELEIIFTDSLYASGSHAPYNSRPITLSYEHRDRYQDGHRTFDTSDLDHDINHETLGFRFQVLSQVIHVYLENSTRWFAHTSVTKNPETSLPYLLPQTQR